MVRTRLLVVIHLSLAVSQGLTDESVVSRSVRVASISLEPVKLDLAGNTNRLEKAFREAAMGGAKIAVAPEGVLDGYVVNEIIAGQFASERLKEVALTIDSPTIKRFQALAAELKICIVFGFAELIGEEIFNCAVFIDNSGRICGKYHKMQFAEGYDENWWFNRLGKKSRAFETPHGRCGILICNDRWNPQLAKIPALDGAQFLVIPSFGSTSKSQDEAVLARGVENNLPVIEANVGVSLIVSDNKISTVKRKRHGITFSQINIPARKKIDSVERDRIEKQFIDWRKVEMQRRLAKRLSKINKNVKPTNATATVSQSADTIKDSDSSVPSIVENGISWHHAKEIGVEGKAWNDTRSFFDRLPARAKNLVRPPVWNLSKHSAGICLRFVSDATSIHARWTLTSKDLAMPHMPATGVSGVDLYVFHESKWRWLSNGRPTQVTNTVRLADELPVGKREYLLYLPLYNGVNSVEVGIPERASIWSKSFPVNRKPIVFWGTSITQGGCASRPGMVHTAILGRRLNRPIINLGFSGNGRMEPEIARLISEIDAAVYVIDCLPNLNGDLVRQRAEPVVTIIRQRREKTPILLVEDRTFSNAFLNASLKKRNNNNRRALSAAFKRLQAAGFSDLHYLRGDGLLGKDGEDTVDGSHPTDLGFVRQANAFESALIPILGESE